MKLQIQPNSVYNMKDAGEVLGVKDETIYSAMKEGKLPSNIIGKGYKFLGKDLLSYAGTGTYKPLVNPTISEAGAATTNENQT